MNIQYLGEHLFPGQMGKMFMWFSFLASILATIFYLVSFYRKNSGRIVIIGARCFYLVHAAMLVSVAAVLYYLIGNHYFEYAYVWQYSSLSLPVEYIISCFWAGQEGSFLIWAIFQALIGAVVLFRARDWEFPVMAVVSFSQVFVTSMLLGVNFLGMKIGGSPFMLLCETVGNVAGTIFQEKNYLTLLVDGNGLNPLLENIWMTIHPPILFLGYALALIPFAYTIASFMKKDHQGWISRTLPWTLLCLAVLGAGILLGGAWAYVSLTFGGFWAWDPVENSSLVPWMTLVAGLHFSMVARKQNFAFFSAFLFTALSYVLVLYASYLTRSGVLANTSAHSFGDNGMTTQLLTFLLTFFLMLIVLLGINFKKIQERRVDILFSREFWIFIGGVIIVLSAFQILLTTSIPVINSIFGTGIAPPVDPVGFYNRWQLPYALLIAGLIAFCQFLGYNGNDPRQFFRKLLFPLILSTLICVPFVVAGIVTRLNFILLLFFIFFALLSSLYNMIFQVTKPRNAAALITHIGFITFLMGALLTFSNSKTISTNTSRFDLGDAKTNAENLMLAKNDTLYMDGFYVVYTDKKVKGNTTEYQIDFLKWKNRKFEYAFSLFPSVNIHPKMGAVYNPDTRHLLFRDYYTYISYAGKDIDYIVIKVIVNPYIKILWIGAIVMIAGFVYAFRKRLRTRWINST